MLIVLATHFIVALIAPLVFTKIGRAAFYLLAAVPAGSLIWLIGQYDAVMSGGSGADSGANGPPTLVIEWIPDLKLELAFRLDALAWILSLLILGVGALVLFYCARYFRDNDAGLGAFGSQLLAFSGVMFGLVIADDLILLYVFWELTSILSYLLIGYSRGRLAARRSALQALIVTTFGGLAMLVGLVMIGQTAGTYRISDIMTLAPALTAGGIAIDIAIALVLIGAITKSALAPFHFWLPAAMAAPTPVSAYLHAAAMVKAGIYLVARFAPGFAETVFWDPLILTLGLTTMLIGGWRALRQTDLKLLLAYGTVSQLGFLTLVVGMGNRDGALAGLALLLAHGLFKGTLFLVVGIIDHQTGTRDIRNLSGLFRSAPWLSAVSLVAAASMAGLPFLGGFVAKESVYAAFVHEATDPLGITLLAGIVIGSMLTFAYSARFIRGGFGRKEGMEDTDFTPVTKAFLVAPLVLTAGTILFGVFPDPVNAWIDPYMQQFRPGAAEDPYLAIWHGFNLPLLLSVLTIAVGLLLFYKRDTVSRIQDSLYPVFDTERGYRKVIGVLDEVAVWVTGRTQRGSLLFYLFVILSTAIVMPMGAFLLGNAPLLPTKWRWFDSPVQAVAGLGIILGALAAVRANKRFLAVLMVAVTGYGIALIFALQGAPDLALTQMLIETMVLVAFVLALRSLPAKLWQRTPAGHRVLRAGIGVAFGLVMMFIAMAAMGSRTAVPISLQYPELAYEVGQGANIVNVILVDIRAWDTYGEISVLAIAATGVASLIFVRGRGDRRRRADGVETGSVDRGRENLEEYGREAAALALARKFSNVQRDAWLVAGRTLAPERRSIIFEVITRLLFHSVVIFSIYLLLAGHNSPGGGFAGGLMAGLALAIRYLAGGRFELAEATPVSAGLLLGLGLGIASLAALVPALLGGEVFQSFVFEATLPVFGEIKFVTSTIFDIGVYLVVVGLVLDVLRSLGSEIDERTENGSDDGGESQRDADRASGRAVSR
ncbi:Na+/H+ antiporter subunit A [Arthrobacter sp. H14]|uniref:Na+/H+ antiporter subunit A n=1 Tax=Arthrobacter sp. H14 TaxID=1312959 RepID=UPI00047E7DDA|nr:Na+/H+ antiporter subunit A [Arthrobacter sp. H14]